MSQSLVEGTVDTAITATPSNAIIYPMETTIYVVFWKQPNISANLYRYAILDSADPCFRQMGGAATVADAVTECNALLLVIYPA